MALLFAGNELTCFQRSGSNVVESTAAGSFDSSRVRCSLLFPSYTTSATSTVFTAVTTIWIHTELLYASGFNNTTGAITLIDSGGQDRVRIGVCGSIGNIFSGSSTWGIQFWNGSAWTTIGNFYAVPTDHRMTLDIMVKTGSSGEVAVYLDSGPLIIHGTADLSSVTNVAQVRLSSFGGFPIGSATNAYYSQLILADEPTIQWSAFSLAPTGAGTHGDWNGTYTDVNEIVLNDSTFIYTDTANQLDTFPVNSITVPAGYIVKGVTLSARARISTAGPQNAQFVVRSAGTDYPTANITGLFYNYQPYQTIYTTDPATSAAWTQSGVNAMEIGFKSIT